MHALLPRTGLIYGRCEQQLQTLGLYQCGTTSAVHELYFVRKIFIFLKTRVLNNTCFKHVLIESNAHRPQISRKTLIRDQIITPKKAFLEVMIFR